MELPNELMSAREELMKLHYNFDVPLSERLDAAFYIAINNQLLDRLAVSLVVECGYGEGIVGEVYKT